VAGGELNRENSEMTNRARFSLRILCVNQRCGQEADVEWAENEDPADGLDRELVRISEGFSRKKSDMRQDPDLICDTCRTVAYLGQSSREASRSFVYRVTGPLAAPRTANSTMPPPSLRHRRILSNTPFHSARARS
jgi:hypothetical protein